MSHDKIRAATRKRMAETGESYAAARREVIREHQAAGGESPRSDTQWFAISYSNSVSGKITTWMDTLFGAGPGKSGVEVGPDVIRVRMAGDKFDIPRGPSGPLAGSRKSSMERRACTSTRRVSCW